MEICEICVRKTIPLMDLYKRRAALTVSWPSRHEGGGLWSNGMILPSGGREAFQVI